MYEEDNRKKSTYELALEKEIMKYLIKLNSEQRKIKLALKYIEKHNIMDENLISILKLGR